MKTRFHNLEEFRAKRDEARLRMDHHGRALNQHLERLRDGDYRAELASHALMDVFKAWRPMRMLSSLGADQGALGGILLTALTSRGKGWKGKLLTGLLSIVGPIMVERFLHSDFVDRWLESVQEEVDEDPNEGAEA